ncbi:MAG: hypothetical protein GWP17_02320 [Aquificales bacterium]|nr:hypothetical protein [Aquificales bacterium]
MGYIYNTPEAAYKEAQRRISAAKSNSGATELSLGEFGLTAVPPELAQWRETAVWHS